MPFCIEQTFRKILLEQKCKVHALIWQIDGNTLKNKQTNKQKTKSNSNKERKARVPPGRKIVLVFKHYSEDLPLFFKAMFIFHLCPLHLEKDRLTVFFPACADVAENPSGQSAMFAHSRFQSTLSFEQGF